MNQGVPFFIKNIRWQTALVSASAENDDRHGAAENPDIHPD